MARELRRQRGGCVGAYVLDAAGCSYRHQASPENYFVLRFYELNEKERETYLTSGRSAIADRRLNRFMSEEKNRIMAHKHLFYQCFSELIYRESIYIPKVSYLEFLAFLDSHETFILKPDRGIMGQGIEKLRTENVENREAFFQRCKAARLLAEQVITA